MVDPETNEGKNWEAPERDPHSKFVWCIRRDMATLKKWSKFWQWPNFENPAIVNGRVADWDNPSAPIFPNHVDLVIIGGGAIGCSVAYWIKKQAGKDFRIVVVEKDPMVNLFINNVKKVLKYFNFNLYIFLTVHCIISYVV